jgi:ribose transport system permease protein
MVLVFVFVVFSVALPETFPTWANVRTMVNSQAIILFLAIAATIPLRTGDFDFSIAAVMTVSACITAQLVTNGQGVLLAFVVALVFGAAVGLVNGFLVVKIGVDAFVTTLGTMTALGGVAYAISNSEVVSSFPTSLLNVSRTEFLGLPALTWYAWVLAAIAWYVYERAPLGRFLLFIGGSREAARLAGIKVDRLRMAAFLASAIISSITGVLLAGSVGSVDPSIGPQYLLQPFAAVFLGATTITVGRFNALGPVVGLYLLVVGITGLQLLGAKDWVPDVFNGVALMLAVTFACLAGRSRSNG